MFHQKWFPAHCTNGFWKNLSTQRSIIAIVTTFPVRLNNLEDFSRNLAQSGDIFYILTEKKD